jgi:hypothetical protein
VLAATVDCQKTTSMEPPSAMTTYSDLEVGRCKSHHACGTMPNPSLNYQTGDCGESRHRRTAAKESLAFCKGIT